MSLDTPGNPILVTVLVMTALAGCDGGKREDARDDNPPAIDWGSGVPVIDVSISSNTPEWTISPMPFVRLGAVSDGDDAQFAAVSFASQRDNGELVVVDGGSMEIRLFDRSGQLLRRVGRRGQGPEEFMGFRRVIRLDADSLLILDDLLQRLSLIGPDLSIVNQYGVEFRADQLTPEDAIGSERYLLSAMELIPSELSHGDTVRTPVRVIAGRMA